MSEKDNRNSEIDINLSGAKVGRDLKIENLTVNKGATVPTDGERLSRRWNLTQNRNKYFTGRKDVLENLTESFQGNSRAAVTAESRQALRGLGGIGKTQLAIEFCHRNRDNYDVVWWVDAEEETNILSNLAEFAGLEGFQADNQLDLAKKAVLWFNENTNWLLVFDNAPNAKAIEAYIPSSEHGHVLITSRWKNWDGVASDVKIDVWSEEEALDFLKDRLGEGADETELKRLAEEMGHLPLAIAHAAAYISTKQVSVSNYLELYSEYRADLHLSEEQLNNYDNTVAAAILLSVKDLEEQNKDIALALLYYCAFLPPEGIDTNFFIDNRDALQDELSEALQNPIKANEYWHDLELLSLIDKQGSTIYIHRVIQAVLLDSLSEEEHKEVYENSLRLLDSVFYFNRVDEYSWRLATYLAPYATYFCEHQASQIYLVKDQSSLLANLARYFRIVTSLFDISEKYLRRAIEIAKKTIGEESLEYTSYMSDLAGQLREIGHYDEAEKLYRNAIEIVEEILGEEDHNYAMCINNLAVLLRDKGCFAEAEPLYRQALEIVQKTLGENCSEYLWQLNNLALLLKRMQRYPEAEALYRQALELGQIIMGNDHPDYPICLNNLADLLREMGQYDKAEPMYKKAIDTAQRTLGEEHPSYAKFLDNFASLLRSTGRYQEAEPHQIRALHIFGKVYGVDHPTYAIGMWNLASLYIIIGRNDEAKSLLEQAFLIFNTELGQDHHYTQQISVLLN